MREDTAPYRNVGSQAINTLGRTYGYGPDGQPTGAGPNNDAFMASPDYNFRRDEGTRDIQGSFAARGGAQSGNALRALTDFSSNLASGEFGNWFNRQSNLAGIGQTATNTSAQVGQNTAANVGNALTNYGNARASGYLAQGNLFNNALTTGLDYWNRRRNRNKP
jgi:hypothetical protein